MAENCHTLRVRCAHFLESRRAIIVDSADHFAFQIRGTTSLLFSGFTFCACIEASRPALLCSLLEFRFYDDVFATDVSKLQVTILPSLKHIVAANEAHEGFVQPAFERDLRKVFS